MNDEEFSNFTNQVVWLSRASEKEQKILFQKLNDELRAHNKTPIHQSNHYRFGCGK